MHCVESQHEINSIGMVSLCSIYSLATAEPKLLLDDAASGTAAQYGADSIITPDPSSIKESIRYQADNNADGEGQRAQHD